jgi:hypothetical protein
MTTIRDHHEPNCFVESKALPRLGAIPTRSRSHDFRGSGHLGVRAAAFIPRGARNSAVMFCEFPKSPAAPTAARNVRA